MARIMVIDDSPMMRDYMRRCLEKANHEVEEWIPLSPMEIPEKLKFSHPDLILCDYQMPGCNGASLARMVQKVDPDLPVVILTAYRDKEMEANLSKFGVKRILHKPINAEMLNQAVQDILRQAASRPG
jgi:DNA-binding NarL/FixJ family response regulator